MSHIFNLPKSDPGVKSDLLAENYCISKWPILTKGAAVRG